MYIHIYTCGQCGKIFCRPDNLSRHCTGHKQLPPPPLPQQRQQQTAARPAPPPKFTIRHQYSSMGGGVEGYTINRQETQHLDQLSIALYLFQSTMKTFHTKHNAYKFQIAITIVCLKAVDPSVVTHPQVTLTSKMIAVYVADTAPPLDGVNRQLLNFTGIRIELIGVCILQLPIVQIDIMAARFFTRWCIHSRQGEQLLMLLAQVTTVSSWPY